MLKRANLLPHALQRHYTCTELLPYLCLLWRIVIIEWMWWVKAFCFFLAFFCLCNFWRNGWHPPYWVIGTKKEKNTHFQSWKKADGFFRSITIMDLLGCFVLCEMLISNTLQSFWMTPFFSFNPRAKLNNLPVLFTHKDSIRQKMLPLATKTVKGRQQNLF